MQLKKMNGLGKVLLPVAAVATGFALWMAPQVSGQQGGSGQPSTKNFEWPMYTADLNGSKYTPAAQIDGSNFNKLEVAWRFKTDSFGTRPEYKLEGTPIMVKGILYATAGTRRSVVALDAKTGELIWAHSMREGNRAAIAPRQLSGRGVSYWTDGKGDDRVVYVSTGFRLIELNAHTGAVINGFGKEGIVDLKEGMYTGTGKQIDLETGEAGLHSTPTVVKDTIIVGSSFKEGMTVNTHNNTKGLVRAYNAKTGKLIWTFHTIPKKGEFGYDTWENGSADTNGNTGVWTQISVDEESGLVYLPVESPTSDYYGGERPGNNLYGESLVCVDLATGQRKWYFQIVHHPVWDYDLSSAPLLMNVNVDGKAIKAVALPSKEAFLYVFDRITGKPVWPIEERPVPQTDVPGEKTAATQPFPTKPPAYARNFLKVPDDLIDFTKEMRAQAIDNISRYKVTNQMFTPPIVGDPKGFLGAINLGNASGGTNWPGAGFDPELHTVFAQAQQSAVTPISLRTPPQGFSDIKYVSGRNDQEFRVAEGPGFGSAADAPQRPAGGGRGGGPAAPPAGAAAGRGGGGQGGLLVEGLPIVKPPYGVISAINIDKGDITWQVPYGETPDAVRRVLAEHKITYGNTGQPGSVGLLITKNLVILGDSQLTTTTGDATVPADKQHPRGAMLRAYDKTNGKEMGAVFMPAPQSGSPMSYMVDGKQYVIVAVSGGSYSGEYIAYALPNN
ncbi:MAG TPA: PQQ-binding-like beta-propeller repeat protein [Bryobacteraceae bacterium]|jgi:quinoprotein glucose dehydrogenase|nr:PQQ-binding-like beta-propeller repeat protein [Bryobacteraceae bacterium]